jgi:predicted regulator of Ras-like GTPase activity (Roadblock/LC7/MglB family)
MLSIFKKLFGKPQPKAVRAIPAQQQPLEPTAPMPTVEVAHLSLEVIVNNLPAEIKALVRQAPTAAATVALPVPTIMKQLASGCVKMSLASLHRQAHGVFAPLANGDKRTVDVPLAEIFRHINPHTLKRRPDQRAFFLPANGFNVFGNAENPYQISPTAPEDEPPGDSMVLDLTPDMPQGLKMSDDPEEPSNGIKPHASPPPPSVSRLVAPGGVKPPPGLSARGEPESRESAAPAAANSAESPVKEEEPPVILPLAPVADTWPEDVRAALGAAIESGANLALPSARLSEGLAKGRVAFTWGQICELITSGAISPGDIDENTSLMIPLRIVAPAFLSATKQPKTPRKGVYLDASIPAPFSGGNARPFTPAAPLPPPSAPSPESSEPSPEASAPLPEANAPLPAPAFEDAPASDAAPEPAEGEHVSAEAEPEAEPVAEFKLAPSPQMETSPAPALAEHGKLPETIGEVFGDPHKQDWTPAEIVQHTVKLSGVAGAVVALQEGLQVASSLPDGVKSDVVAAFLPQIFARLNQYAGEMRLGDVDDLLFTTHGAHCQIYRLGYVYFAVLGKPGESLPWHELRLISEELARQTNK